MPSGSTLARIRQLREQQELAGQSTLARVRQLAQEPETPSLPSRAMWKTLDGVEFILRTIDRPRRAMLAGFEDWLNGGSVTEVFNGMAREFTVGASSGNFERDLSTYDLLQEHAVEPFRQSETTRRVSGVIGKDFSQMILPDMAVRTAGLAGDVIFDPANLIPIAPLFRWAGRWVGSGAALLGRGIDHTPAGPAKDALLQTLSKMWVRPQQITAAGKAAEAGRESLAGVSNETREVLLDNFFSNNRAYRQLIDETGMADEEFHAFMAENFEKIKLRDPDILPEALNDTYQRIYRDYGSETFDRFHETAGRRAIPDERPLRRAILNNSFDEANAELVERWGKDVSDRVKAVLFELKERDLERFVYEGGYMRQTSDVQLPVFESMRKDYLRAAAKPALREWIEGLGWAPQTERGFGINPMHSSDLHSQVQEIGVVKANKLLRTPMEPGSELSQFVVRHPSSGEMVHVPLMPDGGFHTDVRLIDLTRQYYARRAVETSWVLDDLVRGYGRVLDDTIEVVGRDGKKVEVPTWVRKQQVVRPPAVARQGPQEVIGKFGHKLLDDPESWQLTTEAAAELERQGLVLLKGVRGFENTALPKEAADIVHNVNGWQQGALEKVLRPLDTLQNKVWKPMTLFLFPGYYARNVVTNTFLQNHLGMSPADIVRYNARAARILSSGSHANRYRRISEAVQDLAKGTPQEREVFNRIAQHPGLLKETPMMSEAIRLQELVDGVRLEDLPGKDELGLLHILTQMGIVRSGQFGSTEILRSLEEAAEASTQPLARRIVGLNVNTNPILAFGADSAAALEDSQRAAAFLWAIEEKGMDILEARNWVLRGMVDFNHLTEFERNVVRKYAIPFWAWTRNATPLMAESFIDDNFKWRMLYRAKEDQERAMAEDGNVLPDRLVPEYIARGFNVPTTRSPDGEYRYFVMDGWIPQSMLTDVDSVDELMRFLPENAGPVLKSAAELIFQESLFLEREFGEGYRSFLGQRLPESAISVLRGIRALNTVDALLFRAENPTEQAEQVVRFATGLNIARLSRARAVQVYDARVRDKESAINAAIAEAAREGHHDEIPALVRELRNYKLRGRESKLQDVLDAVGRQFGGGR